MPGNGAVKPYQLQTLGAFGLVACPILGALTMFVDPTAYGVNNIAAASSGPAGARGREPSGSFLHQFGPKHDAAHWYKSDFMYPNSAHPAWKAELIHFENNRIDLEVRREKTGYKTIAGAEYQRRGFFHCGRYEVVMKPARGSGTVSAMFTHTHGQFGDPHDEIDIEFLGNRPRQLHLNYFTDGKAAGSIYVPLGFDATKEVHLYAFEWEPDEISWYVDDKFVHTAPADFHAIPQAPGRLIVHLWSGGREQHDWHGRPTFRDGTRASVYCLSFRAQGDSAAQCSDTFSAKR